MFNKHGKNKNYSIARKLRNEKKTSIEFEIMLSNLTLEEVIALKLEMAAKSLGGKLYGFKLWDALGNISRDAAFKFAVSATTSKKSAMRLLGISSSNFNKLYKKYEIDGYFEENNLTENA